MIREKEIISHRFETADQLILWIGKHHQITKTSIPEIAANSIITIISITSMLLKRQIQTQADNFEKDGGFTERMYNIRKNIQMEGKSKQDKQNK